MKKSSRAFIALALLGAAASTVTPAMADRGNSLCGRQAKNDFLLCESDCTVKKKTAELVCRAGTNATLAACYESCGLALGTCITQAITERVACKTQCLTTFDAAVTACKAACVGSCDTDPAYKTCLDTAVTALYACKQPCWGSKSENRGERSACQQTFHDCVDTCGGVPGTGGTNEGESHQGHHGGN